MHPYENQPSTAFWNQAVSRKDMTEISGLWDPKFHIGPQDRVATYGSCFAQHISSALQKRNYAWQCSENAPFGMTPTSKLEFGYEIFSSRTTNIYTTSFLKNWTEWALNPSGFPDEIWSIDDRFIDPLRPTVEPDGFASRDELDMARQVTAAAFKQSVVRSKFFIFTLGLTERWVNTKSNMEYSICPGTAGGEFLQDRHVFSNMDYPEIHNNLEQAIRNLLKMNSKIKIILTVSPVPLVATAGKSHVLVATMHSKSLLRSVAGWFAENHPSVDYFPSYEMINSPVSRGAFFEQNMRAVSKHGVNFVMDAFFSTQTRKFGPEPTDPEQALPDDQNPAAPTICEEELLNAFGKDT